jgi:hypothetical protein
MLAWKKNQNNQFSTLPGLKKVIIIIIIIIKKKKRESTLHVKMWTCEKKKKGLCLRKKGH